MFKERPIQLTCPKPIQTLPNPPLPTGVPSHPYDPLGPDGKPVRPLAYHNVRAPVNTAGVNHGVVRRPVGADEYPLYTS
jgi:hypothetical protein